MSPQDEHVTSDIPDVVNDVEEEEEESDGDSDETIDYRTIVTCLWTKVVVGVGCLPSRNYAATLVRSQSHDTLIGLPVDLKSVPSYADFVTPSSYIAEKKRQLIRKNYATQQEKRQFAKQFLEAKKAVRKSWFDNDVFELVDVRKLKIRNFVAGRWVLTIKKDKDGNFLKCSLRVSKIDRRIPSRPTALRPVVLVLVARRNLPRTAVGICTTGP